MKMREVGSIEIKPAEKIAMQPGNGYHIMMIGLTQQLKAGDKVPMTLTFEKQARWMSPSMWRTRTAGKTDEHMHH